MSVIQKKGVKTAHALPKFDVALSRTRRAQVADTLRNFVLSGQLAPGTQLVEAKLASRFGVSRGSIREAIWELIDQGLLINRPYAGTFVISLDEKTMIEVFSLRGALERYAFTLLWPKRDGVFREEFTARHKALVNATRTQTRFDVIKAEMRFHSYSYEFCGNRVLLEVWEQLSQKVHLSFVISQAIVRGTDFLGESERYYTTALGDDLAEMLVEIDRHLELGMLAVRRFAHNASPPASKTTE